MGEYIFSSGRYKGKTATEVAEIEPLYIYRIFDKFEEKELGEWIDNNIEKLG